MRSEYLVLWSAVFCGGALSQSLQSVLLDNGFTQFAVMVEGAELPASGNNLIVYAPTDAAFEKNGGAVLARRFAPGTGYYFSDSIAPTFNNATNTAPGRRRLARDASIPPCGIARQTWLGGADKVNLGPGRNQTLVEKKVCAASAPLVFTGLGASVKVTADDIPFDRGVIRPVSG